MNRCVIVGAGKITDYDTIKSMIHQDDCIVCADAGYVHVQKMGLTPSYVLGDFDSSETMPAKGKIIRVPVEKDETDTFLCMEYCIELGCRELLFLGCTGGRLDHTYSNLLNLKYADENGILAVMADENNMVYASHENHFTVPKKEGYKISFFGLCTDIKGLTLRGCKYPLTDKYLPCGSSLCISNEALGDRGIEVSKKDGTMLIMLSKD